MKTLEKINDIIEFTWERNKLWRELITKEQLIKFFQDNQDSLYVYRNNGIELVAFYQILNDSVHFHSVTVKSNGIRLIREHLKLILKKEKLTKASWFNQKHIFKVFKTKGV